MSCFVALPQSLVGIADGSGQGYPPSKERQAGVMPSGHLLYTFTRSIWRDGWRLFQGLRPFGSACEGLSVGWSSCQTWPHCSHRQYAPASVIRVARTSVLRQSGHWPQIPAVESAIRLSTCATGRPAQVDPTLAVRKAGVWGTVLSVRWLEQRWGGREAGLLFPAPAPWTYAAIATLICLGLASSRSGSRTVNTPALYSALTLAASIVGGSANVRANEP